MADILETNTEGNSSETGDQGIQTTESQPVVATPAGPSAEFMALQERMAQAEINSQALLQQMMRNDQARSQQSAPEVVIPQDILEGATPIVKRVLKDQLGKIDQLENMVHGLVAENQGSKERSFIYKNVPDFDSLKMDVAKHIHSQLDDLGVPQDPNIRRQFFNPTAVVAVANLLKGQKTAPVAASDELASRSVVEGRGGGTSPASVASPVDYTTMTNAEFAKREAQIQAKRMQRNHG